MIDNFSKKKGEDARALEFYTVATMANSTEAALQYLMALREAKLALCE